MPKLYSIILLALMVAGTTTDARKAPAAAVDGDGESLGDSYIPSKQTTQNGLVTPSKNPSKFSPNTIEFM